MMYVMCYFQVLSQPKVVIEDATQTTKQSTPAGSEVRTVFFFSFIFLSYMIHYCNDILYKKPNWVKNG
jgi:hypothetical protein